MSNRSKDGDFNLDEELRSQIAANDEGAPILDDHEDESTGDTLVTGETLEIRALYKTLEKKYGIHPQLKRRPELVNSDVILSVRNLKQFFFFGGGFHRTKLKAVSNISFDVHAGECFGIVGESGCGKTTTGRSIIKLYEITSGSVYYKGFRISAGERWNKKEIKYTKIRLNAKLKELKRELEAKILDLKLNLTGTELNERIADAITYYNEEVQKATDYANNIIAVQKKKIQQVHDKGIDEETKEYCLNVISNL